MKTYLVTLKIGDFHSTAESRPINIRELWYTGLHLMRLMKHNSVKGRFVVRNSETCKTIFWLNCKPYGDEYRARLASIGYGEICGGYTF